MTHADAKQIAVAVVRRWRWTALENAGIFDVADFSALDGHDWRCLMQMRAAELHHFKLLRSILQQAQQAGL